MATNGSTTTSETVDALIVGAGFAGIYQLYRLRELGLTCLVVDQAGDVGGTWYWNLYPGAMSDTESYVYRYSWDRADLLAYPWREHYVKQPDVLAYLRHVVERHDLRRHMRFRTQMVEARWDDDGERWGVTLDDADSDGGGERGRRMVNATYLVTGLGLLSKQNFPDIPGIEDFEGEKHHTAKWPQDLDLTGKSVGVIGCGSTGVQVITELGRKVGRLVAYQRHPQYSVPSADREFTAEERAYVNENWDDIFARVRDSVTAFGFEESTRSYHDAIPAEREAVFEDCWRKGNGFRFMFGSFNDIAVDAEANEGACEFIRAKIRSIVRDPEKARKLQPHDVYARRPLCDGNARSGQRYFEQFNRENVDIVHLGENPIERVEGKGIRLRDGTLEEHDVIVFATGFDAVEGNYTRINIHGRGGLSLRDSWEETGPTAYLGFIVPEFPNLFMISGPKGPFTNIPPAIESQIEFISQAIRVAGKKPRRPIEPTREAEREWSEECEALAAKSLFWNAADNWIFGANIAGKKRCLRFYFGGMKKYREALRDCERNGYKGFKPFLPESEASKAAPHATHVEEVRV